MTDTALAEENARLKARLTETEAALADAVEAQRRLESIVSELRRERFGPRSEKLDPEQFNLPLKDVELAQGVLEAAQEKARRALKGQCPASSAPNRNRGHVHRGTVWRALRGLGLTHKKDLQALEQKGKDVAGQRHIWIAKRQRFMANPLERLAFVDETSVKTNMAKTTGWARCGQRLIDHAPFGQAPPDVRRGFAP